jgi:sortase A
MARANRSAEDLSVEELETILARKKMEARRARLRKFRRSGRALQLEKEPSPEISVDDFRARVDSIEASPLDEPRAGIVKRGFNRFLLLIEIGAVLGLGFVLFSGFDVLKSLNEEAAQIFGAANPSPTPLITAVVLPSGHTPPTSPGGAQPNEAEIPEHLRPLVQSLPAPIIPTPGPEQAQSIFIPALWDAPAPVVQGDGWEQLKKGVAQHIGSSDPGRAGNLVLSAHNDIFGELFRYLDQLTPGDEIIITTATKQHTYRVTGTRIVEPTEVSVMEPTSKPTVTLISCYPYLIDNQRIVVFGELVDA